MEPEAPSPQPPSPEEREPWPRLGYPAVMALCAAVILLAMALGDFSMIASGPTRRPGPPPIAVEHPRPVAPPVAVPETNPGAREEALTGLSAQMESLNQRIASLETQRSYYLDKARSLNARATTRNVPRTYYTSSNGTVTYQSGCNIHSDGAQAVRAESQAAEYSRQIDTLHREQASVRARMEETYRRR